MSRPRPPGVLAAWGAFGVGAIYMLWVASAAWGDPLGRYAVTFPDSFDWLVNGLRHAGVPIIDPTWRAPLSPMLYGVLFRIGAEDLIPVLGPLYAVALLGVVAWLAPALVGRAAAPAILLLATNRLVLSYMGAIGSDTLVVCLVTLGLLLAVQATASDSTRHWWASGAAFGLGYLAQPSLPLLVPSLGALVLCGKAPWRSWRGWRGPLLAVVIGTLVVCLVELLRWPMIGLFRPPTNVMRPVLIPSGHLGFFALASLGSCGIPAALSVCVGALVGIRRVPTRPLAIASTVLIVTHLIFFGTIYDWRDTRFVLYWTPAAMLLAGIALTAVPRPLALLAVLLSMVIGNLMPRGYQPLSPDAVMILGPQRVASVSAVDGRLRWADMSVQPFHHVFGRWLAHRRTALTNPRNDDAAYGVERVGIVAAAVEHMPEQQVLYVAVGADLSAGVSYILRNTFAIHARRGVRLLVATQDPLPQAPAFMVVQTTLLNEWRAMPAGGPRITVLQEAPRWAAVRLEGPGA